MKFLSLALLLSVSAYAQAPSGLGAEFDAMIHDLPGEVDKSVRPPCVSCQAAEEGTSSERLSVLPFERAQERTGCFPASSTLPGIAKLLTIQSVGCQGGGAPGREGVSLTTDTHSPFFTRGPGIGPDMSRTIKFMAVDGSRAGAMVYISDDVSLGDSNNNKTTMLLIPRRGIPQAAVVGNEIHVVLPTGELVVFDALTRRIKNGTSALKEVTAGSPGHFPDLRYTGAGISIEASRKVNGNPFQVPANGKGERLRDAKGNLVESTVVVRQKNKTCTVSRGALFNLAGRPLANDDASLVQALNRSCPGQGFHL